MKLVFFYIGPERDKRTPAEECRSVFTDPDCGPWNIQPFGYLAHAERFATSMRRVSGDSKASHISSTKIPNRSRGVKTSREIHAKAERAAYTM